ncbi:MAG: hypothetical protein ACXVLQ_12105 [Bacteriovorax sp.]
MKLFLSLIILVLTGCASSSKSLNDYSHLGEPTSRDYIDHLASAGDVYLNNDETHELKLRPESIQYLEQIYERIVSNNELLLSREFTPKFHVIKNKTPFLFSLPKAQFFLSNGLIEKYLKSEELFVAAFTAEILKSNRSIYEKKIMVPLGVYNTEKMIQITRLKAETKKQINEWSYFVLKRAGFDASAYLNWIQVQNRNSLDFSLYLGDALGISKEEHLFKDFMTKQGVLGVEKKINEANSSKAFYKLLNNIASNK